MEEDCDLFDAETFDPETFATGEPAPSNDNEEASD
ncbi:hypothetical protein ABIF26_007439 [Bradyrhizobium elkanii]